MRFTGAHILGRGRARTLGFPTINLHNINTTIEEGVYAAWTTIKGVNFMTAMFVGDSPTFRDKEQSVELNLIGLSEADIKIHHLDKLITHPISVETVRYIRPVVKFNSRNELIRQIGVDVVEIAAILSSQSTGEK